MILVRDVFQAKYGQGGTLVALFKEVYIKKMVWLMPRMQRAVPYLGYIVVAGTKPA